MKKLIQAIIGNEQFFIRTVLFLAFVGHGLVSLHVSDGYKLHYNIFAAVNIFNLDVSQTLIVFGIFDILIALSFLLNFQLKYLAPLAIIYLLAVGISGGLFYMKQNNQLFGLAELFRRIPWIFCALFLWIIIVKKNKHHYILRIGIAFAFIAHGFASLGFLGLSGGHIELASKILTEEAAKKFVYYSGILDSILGLMLISGFLSQLAAIIGAIWLAFVVVLSLQVGLPEGIFRSGFFLTCFFVALDKRCHFWRSEKITDNNC